MYDYVIVGGGIIGVSTAWQLKNAQPDCSVLLLEKEAELACHQTGHNSGVIHSGIYYAPGSLKAEFCKAGMAATYAFCQENGIRVEQCGKLLVATDELEHDRMLALFARARQNGLDVELLAADELRRRESNVRGVGAIFARRTGIVDYGLICRRMAELFERRNGELKLDYEVAALQEKPDRIVITTATGESFESRFLITCAGLLADRITRMLGLGTDFQIIPYRGEYYRLPAAKSGPQKPGR